MKVVRKFAQKNCSEKDVLSLRNIEREITVKKINNVKQTSIVQFYNYSIRNKLVYLIKSNQIKSILLLSKCQIQYIMVL